MNNTDINPKCLSCNSELEKIAGVIICTKCAYTDKREMDKEGINEATTQETMGPKIQKCIYCPIETDLKLEMAGHPCSDRASAETKINREANLVPAHYDKVVQPWDLERVMETSGDCFVDARRTDIIEYIFRKKVSMLEDMKKARHCLDAAIAHMEKLGMK